MSHNKNKTKMAKRVAFAPCEGQLSMDTSIDMPDWALAQFLRDCEEVGDGATNSRVYAAAFDEAGKRRLLW